MRCPFCGFDESRVVDSRATMDKDRIRRRRECLKCAKRFTTYEIIESTPLIVIKKDHSREPFDREKLMGRMLRACGKRPVPIERLEQAVSEIQNELLNQLTREVPSRRIADLAMQKLKDIDIVAYVRFVSVYREFSSISEFMMELQNLDNAKQ